MDNHLCETSLVVYLKKTIQGGCYNMEKQSKKLKGSLWPMEVLYPWNNGITIHINKDGVLVEPSRVGISQLFIIQYSPKCLKFEPREGYTSEEILQEIIDVIINTSITETIHIVEPKRYYICCEVPSVIHYEHLCTPKTYGDIFKVLGDYYRDDSGIVYYSSPGPFTLYEEAVEPMTSLAHKEDCLFQDPEFANYDKMVDFVTEGHYISMYYWR